MTETMALQIKNEIEAVLQKHGVFYSVTKDIDNRKLKAVRFNEIAIKVKKGQCSKAVAKT